MNTGLVLTEAAAPARVRNIRMAVEETTCVLKVGVINKDMPYCWLEQFGLQLGDTQDLNHTPYLRHICLV